MYVPPFNVLAPGAARDLVRTIGAAELVTSGPQFPSATRMPVIWDQDRLLFHMAWANPHWRSIAEDMPALAIVTGPEAYISPSFYATKREHGRVVPTWNYSAVQFTGHVRVHHDMAWKLELVTRLTEVHEQDREQPWAVTDAPAAFVEQQLKAIVGIELRIAGVEAKAKLSQNRSEADRDGVVEGLRVTGRPRDAQVADDMASASAYGPPGVGAELGQGTQVQAHQARTFATMTATSTSAPRASSNRTEVGTG